MEGFEQIYKKIVLYLVTYGMVTLKRANISSSVQQQTIKTPDLLISVQFSDALQV